MAALDTTAIASRPAGLLDLDYASQHMILLAPEDFLASSGEETTVKRPIGPWCLRPGFV